MDNLYKAIMDYEQYYKSGFSMSTIPSSENTMLAMRVMKEMLKFKELNMDINNHLKKGKFCSECGRRFENDD